MLFFSKFILGLFLNYFINFFLVKKKFLLDDIKSSSHKKFTNNQKVPLSGGLIFVILFLIFIEQNYILKFFSIGIFIIGFFSDTKIINSPLIRFLNQTILIVSFIIIGNVYVNYTNLYLLDLLLSNYFFSLVFTSLCFLILINGINFLDGLNSLVLAYNLMVIISLIILISYFNLNFDFGILYNLLIILIVILIFNIFNKNFIGDSGAYVISFVTGVTLINFYNLNNNSMSSLFIVIMLWYPAIEILFSIIRKLFYGNDPLKPDNLHLHQLVYKFLKTKFDSNFLSNIFAAILINFYNLIIFAISLFFIKETNMLSLLIITNIICYVMVYFFLKEKNKKITK